jgi:hypothetical protein
MASYRVQFVADQLGLDYTEIVLRNSLISDFNKTSEMEYAMHRKFHLCSHTKQTFCINHQS